jgi:hypothetical protein
MTVKMRLGRGLRNKSTGRRKGIKVILGERIITGKGKREQSQVK